MFFCDFGYWAHITSELRRNGWR